MTAESDGAVRGPPLEGEHSDLGRRFWEALRRSGQSVWYEESDWVAAELVVAAVDAFVAAPTASMFRAISSLTAGLLVTEGDRRRLQIELVKPTDVNAEDAAISELAHYRSLLDLDQRRERLTGRILTNDEA